MTRAIVSPIVRLAVSLTMQERHALVCIVAMLVLGLSAMLSHAGNLTFLRNTSFALLDDTDRALQLDAAKRVLESDDARSSQEWTNPSSGSSGRVQSLGIFKSEDGLHCRKVRVSSTSQGVESRLTIPVCRTSDGDWLIASGKQLERA